MRPLVILVLGPLDHLLGPLDHLLGPLVNALGPLNYILGPLNYGLGPLDLHSEQRVFRMLDNLWNQTAELRPH